MSGSAGLAAAKRRRAAPSPTMNEAPRRPVPDSKMAPPPVSNIGNSHPLLILAQHEQQIQSLQRELDVCKQTKPQSSSAVMDEQSIQHFKRQYESMSEEVQEMKKLLIKIQTFSMETNLELLKMKRLLKNDPRLKDNDEVSVEGLAIDE